MSAPTRRPRPGVDAPRRRGANAPLFDRIRGRAGAPLADAAFYGHGAEELQESIAYHLSQLLNTRRVPVGDGAYVERTTIGYGVRDFTGLSPLDKAVRARLGEAILDAIQDFEPRLEAVEVQLADALDDERRLHVSIRGIVRTRSVPVVLEFNGFARNGAIEVGTNE